MEIAKEDLHDLRRAKRLLEKTSFSMRLANAIGKPVDAFVKALPAGASEAMLAATHKALEKALAAAIRSLQRRRPNPNIDVHKAAVIATGAVGGAFGFAALVPELTVSTTVMLRAIAEIAREEGESFDSTETKLACLEVFALGGPGGHDDTADTGYFAVRAAMATALEEAAQHVARRGMTREGAPALIRLIALVATRLGVPVSEKIVAQSIPIVGAVGGASINLVFLTHFQDLGRTSSSEGWNASTAAWPSRTPTPPFKGPRILGQSNPDRYAGRRIFVVRRAATCTYCHSSTTSTWAS